MWLRGAGNERDALGYTWNASLGGLFVRTLHPFDVGQELWVDVTPPRSTRRVRLAATVAWRRPFTATGEAPAGVGLRVDEGLPGDVARYRDGMARLTREKGLPEGT